MVIKFNGTTGSIVVSIYVVEWCPIVYFYLLNSVYRVLQAINMPSNQRRKPPRPQSGSKRGKRTSRSNHKGDKLQLWDILDMRNALVQYFSQRAPGYTGKKLAIRRLPMHTASPEKPSVNEYEAPSLACLAISLEVRATHVFLPLKRKKNLLSISVNLHNQDSPLPLS